MGLVHGTALAIGSAGVLLRGPSGAGKSDLALRCLACQLAPFSTRRFVLVADDQVLVACEESKLKMRPPPTLRGLIEVRGIGIRAIEYVDEADLDVVVDLVAPQNVTRMPDPAETVIEGITIPRIALAPFEASAPLKIVLALLGAKTS